MLELSGSLEISLLAIFNKVICPFVMRRASKYHFCVLHPLFINSNFLLPDQIFGFYRLKLKYTWKIYSKRKEKNQSWIILSFLGRKHNRLCQIWEALKIDNISSTWTPIPAKKLKLFQSLSLIEFDRSRVFRLTRQL